MEMSAPAPKKPLSRGCQEEVGIREVGPHPVNDCSNSDQSPVVGGCVLLLSVRAIVGLASPL